MTKIIHYLHQIGAHELDQLSNAELIIDMGGVVSKVYADLWVHNRVDDFKANVTCPILSFEIDEVDDEPFYLHKVKMPHIWNIARIGARYVEAEHNVYSVCLAGQNRSGFINAMILIQLGYHHTRAVEIIQAKRELALNNDLLREYILGPRW